MSGEFEIIRRYFRFAPGPGVDIGVGDDAAVLRPSLAGGRKIAVSVDTINEGVHFFPDLAADKIARFAVVVNASDIAAMGAAPGWMLVALSAPAAGREWFARFARGLRAGARENGFSIVGGDLTRAAAVSVSITAMGIVAASPLTRAGARPGDDIWISGALGDAAVWRREKTRNPATQTPFPMPRARLALGARLAARATASAAMDISDGALATARAVCEASNAAAQIEIDKLPPGRLWRKAARAKSSHGSQSAHDSQSARDSQPSHGSQSSHDFLRGALVGGGDEYELFFCAAAAKRRAVLAAARGAQTAITRVGRIIAGRGVSLFFNGRKISASEAGGADGYEHDFGG